MVWVGGDSRALRRALLHLQCKADRLLVSMCLVEAEKVGEQVKAELHNKKGFCWLAKFGISTGSGLLAFCWFKMAKMASCKKNCAATGNRGDCDGSCALVRL